MPLSEWKRFYCETIQDPIRSGLYARREFFDVGRSPATFHPAAGARSHPGGAGRSCADGSLLANDTLAHLPLFTFYEGLVLELDGEQRDSFDIAPPRSWPIADAARVFALAGRRIMPPIRCRGWKRGRRISRTLRPYCAMPRSLPHRALLSDARRRIAHRAGHAGKLRSAPAQNGVRARYSACSNSPLRSSCPNDRRKLSRQPSRTPGPTIPRGAGEVRGARYRDYRARSAA